MVEHLDPGNPYLIHYLRQPGGTYESLYTTVGRQAGIYAYVDIFKVFAVLSLVAMVLSCFLKKMDLSEGGEGGH